MLSDDYEEVHLVTRLKIHGFRVYSRAYIGFRVHGFRVYGCLRRFTATMHTVHGCLQAAFEVKAESDVETAVLIECSFCYGGSTALTVVSHALDAPTVASPPTMYRRRQASLASAA